MKKKKIFLITFIILFFLGPIYTWNATGFKVGGPLVDELGIVYRISWFGGLKILSALVFGSIFGFVQPGYDLAPSLVSTLRDVLYDLAPSLVNTLRYVLLEYRFRLVGHISWILLLTFSGIGAVIVTLLVDKFQKSN